MHVWSKPRRAQALLASIALLAAAVPLAVGARPASAAHAGLLPPAVPYSDRFLITSVATAAEGSPVGVSACGFAINSLVTIEFRNIENFNVVATAGQQLPVDSSGCLSYTTNNSDFFTVPVGLGNPNTFYIDAYDASRSVIGSLIVSSTSASPANIAGNAQSPVNVAPSGGSYSPNQNLSLGGTGFFGADTISLSLVSTSNPVFSTDPTRRLVTNTVITSSQGVFSGASFTIPANTPPGAYFLLADDLNGSTFTGMFALPSSQTLFDVAEICVGLSSCPVSGSGTGGGGGGTSGSLGFSPNPGIAGQTETVIACGFISGSGSSASVNALNLTTSITTNLTAGTSISQTPSQLGTNCYTYSFPAPAAGPYTFTISNNAITDTGFLQVNATATATPTPAGLNTNLTFSPISALPGTQVTASGCNFSATDAVNGNFTLNIGGLLIKPTSISQPLGFGSTCYSFVFTVPQVVPGTYAASAAGPNQAVGGTDSGLFTVLGGSITATPTPTGGNGGNGNGGNGNGGNGSNGGGGGGGGATVIINGGGFIPGNNGGLIIGTSASLSAVPSSVVAGGSTTVSGGGFYPGASVTLSAPGLGLSTTILDPYGSFTYTVTPPSTTVSGTYTIMATDSTGRTASTTLVVSGTRSASLAASSTSGTVGQQITVTGTGFAAYEQFTLYLNTPGTTPAIAGTVQIYNADANGNFSVIYTVPSTVSGTYYLSALGQSSRINPYISFNVLNGLYQIGGSSVVQTVQAVQTVQVQAVTQVVQVVSVSQSATLPAVSTAATTTYFADGYTGTVSSNGKATFTVKLYLYNPSNATSSVTTGYAVLDPSSNARTLYSVTDSVPAGATLVRSVNTDVGNNKQVSAMVKASGGIVAEEVITRVGADGSALDAASTLGSSHLSTNWYFAEGYTGESLQEYITLYNPSATAANAEIKYMPTVGNAPLAQSVSVPANGQVTVNVRAQYNLLSPAGSKSIGAQVTSDQAIAVDRAMYWGDGDGSGKYGYSLGSGISTPAATQYFAFLPTSDGSQSFVTVLNPSGSSSIVTLNLLSQSGSTVKSVSASVNANARYTFVVPSIIAGAGAISGGLVSSQTPVIAEAGIYFGGSPNIGRHPGIVVQGSNGSQIGARANVSSAGGELHIFNPGTTSIRVQVQLGTTSGTATVSDITLAGQATKVLTVASGLDPQSVVVRGSGFFTAVLVNGGVGNSQAWGGNLN